MWLSHQLASSTLAPIEPLYVPNAWNEADYQVRKEKSSMSRPVITVIDADPVFLELLAEVLSGWGFEPLLHSRSDQAFDMIVEARPDVVLLDWGPLHRRAGEMVLGLLHVDPTTRNIPVIVMTTNPKLLEEKAPVLVDTRCSILPKPFNLDDLHALIQAALRSSSVAE